MSTFSPDSSFNLFSVISTPIGYSDPRVFVKNEDNCESWFRDGVSSDSTPSLDGGTVTVNATDSTFTFVPSATASFYDETSGQTGVDWFDPAFEAEVETAGGDDFPAFAGTLSTHAAPSGIVAPPFVPFEDYQVQWNPRGADSGEVQLDLLSDGNTQARVRCRTTDAGDFTIPWDFVEPLWNDEVEGIRLRVTQTDSVVELQSNDTLIELRTTNERGVDLTINEP